MSSPTIARTRRRIRIRRWRQLFLVGAAVIVIGASLTLFTIHITEIRAIGVSGVSEATERIILAQSEKFLASFRWGILPQKNLALANTVGLIRALQNEIPQIKNIALDRQFLEHRLIIQAQEREPWALWCATNSDDCPYIDQDGALFGLTAKASSSPLLKIEANQRNSIRPQSIIAMVMRLQTLANVQIAHATLEPKSPLITLKTSEGWNIYLEDGGNIDRVAENLASLLKSLESRRSRIDYIDLRVPDKGFYKLH